MGKSGQLPAHVIIICDGMSNARINPVVQYAGNRENLGRPEIDRLVGSGKQFGKGTLATFLRNAVHAPMKNNSRIHLISLRPLSKGHGDPPADMSEFPPELADIFSLSHVIETGNDNIPWKEICESIGTFIGQPFTEAVTDSLNVRFLIVGSSTEGRLFTIASQLRNGMGCENVAVSSHLLGSVEKEAHYAALRHMYSTHGVKVILGLAEAYQYAGLQLQDNAAGEASPCAIEPQEIREELGPERERIVELLCLHWSRCILHPLSGGFSGSFLFVAKGWKNDAQTEPMVLKIDNFNQMRREINGYFEVKDLLGKHIPHFGYPVSVGDNIGVGMELATMDGNPETLQDTFEEADIENTAALFNKRLEKALTLISERLYANTRKLEHVSPYHQFGLNSSCQVKFLQQNIDLISSYITETPSLQVNIDLSKIPQIFQMITSNDDGIESDTCIAHGDLNFQNIICDHVENIWFIDWTHCGRHPIELDFAKLENDIKFVMSKEFDLEDLPQLRKFENYLLINQLPGDEKEIPDNLRFVKWDLRYRKILSAVRLIRKSCFSLKAGEGWLVYQIALLKYATHTLSFDKRRNRGECNLQQLTHVLFSTEQLMMNLAVDDFHLKIRGAKHPSYPPRHRISIDYASWRFDCPDYSPPYHVALSVIENDYTKIADGWAEPENIVLVEKEFEDCNRDKDGRPLHPRGRTGLAGRGLLGRWGANPAVNCVIFRSGIKTDSFEVLLCKKDQEEKLTLPRGFVYPGQSEKIAIASVLKKKCGWSESDTGEIISQGIAYDDRQTDHAWVEMTTFSLLFDKNKSPGFFSAEREYEEVSWWTVDSVLTEILPPFEKEYLMVAAAEALKFQEDFTGLFS